MSSSSPRRRAVLVLLADATRRNPHRSSTPSRVGSPLTVFLAFSPNPPSDPSSFPQRKLNGSKLDLRGLYAAVTFGAGSRTRASAPASAAAAAAASFVACAPASAAAAACTRAREAPRAAPDIAASRRWRDHAVCVRALSGCGISGSSPSRCSTPSLSVNVRCRGLFDAGRCSDRCSDPSSAASLLFRSELLARSADPSEECHLSREKRESSGFGTACRALPAPHHGCTRRDRHRRQRH